MTKWARAAGNLLRRAVPATGLCSIDAANSAACHATISFLPRAPRTAPRAPARHRQQELFVLVAAPVAAAAPFRRSLRRAAAEPRHARVPRRDRPLVADAHGAGAARRRPGRARFAGDLRIRQRTLARRPWLARGPERAREGARRGGGNAFGLPCTAHADADELPAPARRVSRRRKGAGRHRPHPAALAGAAR